MNSTTRPANLLRIGLAASVLAALLGATSFAAVDTVGQPQTFRTLTDAQFVDIAAHMDRDEIDGARFMLGHAKNPYVRAYAGKAIADQSLAVVSLRTAARSAGTPVAEIVRSGFTAAPVGDDRYMAVQIVDRRTMLAALDAEARSTAQPTLRDYALAQIPVVQHQLDAASAYVVSGGTTLGDTPFAGNGVTAGFPTTGSLMNGIPLANGSSEAGGPSSLSGSGVSGSNTGETPQPLPTLVPAAAKSN
jgi:predicted outer membrane protein